MLKNSMLIGVTLLSLFSIKSIFFTDSLKENSPSKIIYSRDNIEIKSSDFFDDVEDFESLDENESKSESQIEEEKSGIDSDIRLLFKQAETLISEKEYKEALEIYNKIIEMSQNSTEIEILGYLAEANFLKGDIYKKFLRNKYEALKCYDKVIERFKNSKDVELLKLYLTAQEKKAPLIDVEDAIYIYDEIANRLKNSKDVTLLQKFSSALKNKATLLRESDDIIETYDIIIDKFRDTENKILLKELLDAQISKAFMLSEGQDDYDEVIDVYDEIIEKFDQYEEYKENVSDALFTKSYFVGKEDKEKSMEILDTIIERYKDTPDKLESRNFEYSVINNIELALVTNSDDSQYRELANEYLLNISDTKPQLEMLDILRNAQDLDQTQAMSEWKKKYKDYQFENWSFETLDEWKDTIEDSEAKSRIEEYLNEFRKHNNG